MTKKPSGAGIPAAICQEAMEAADNAADRGLGDFPTPIEFSKILRALLPTHLPVITDLTGGRGQLALGVSDWSTEKLLLCDIQSHQAVKTEPGDRPIDISRITGDVTSVYPLMVEAKFEGDLFALNPPFSLHWHKDKLKLLASSEVSAVREGYSANDRVVGKDGIESTVATWLMALDRSSQRGEGVIIGNADTLERLVFNESAPYRALRRHVWVYFTMAGNPCIPGNAKQKWGGEQRTIIAYWARSHESGPSCEYTAGIDSPEALKNITFHVQRHNARRGVSVTSNALANPNSFKLWDAVRTEWNQRQKPKRTDFNIWLQDGIIKCQLSRFDECRLVDKQDAARLFALAEQRPMQLVMQVNTRAALRRAVDGTMWRVSTDLPAEVERCIQEYNACRAPLTPLNSVLRLGHLDEHDTIICKKSLTSP